MTGSEGTQVLDLAGLDPTNIPQHVGLILDGNGRWANQRGFDRTVGHAAGEAALFSAIDGALAVGIKWLTAFTFSTENWTRSESEVEFLMFFNRDILERRRDELHAKGVAMHFMGILDDPRVPDRNREIMAEAESMTAGNDRLHVVFAFNYGGRADIARAARRAAALVAAGDIQPDDVDEALIGSLVGIPGMPDADLIVRSSGEHRISNFLLWQAAYSELVFPNILWPDYDAQALVDSVVEYQGRVRRFGSA